MLLYLYLPNDENERSWLCKYVLQNSIWRNASARLRLSSAVRLPPAAYPHTDRMCESAILEYKVTMAVSVLPAVSFKEMEPKQYVPALPSKKLKSIQWESGRVLKLPRVFSPQSSTKKSVSACRQHSYLRFEKGAELSRSTSCTA